MWEYFNTSVHFNENFIQIKTPPKPESQTTVIKSLKYQKKLVICIHKEIEIYSQTCMFLSEHKMINVNTTHSHKIFFYGLLCLDRFDCINIYIKKKTY